MFIHNYCQSAIQSCMDSKTFAVARLYKDEKTIGIHIHNCYEIYYSISGGKQFFIDGQTYDFLSGDIFFINPFENHYLSKVEQAAHERVVVFVHPTYLERLSTPQTDLGFCFTCRSTVFSHKLTLTEEERSRFLYFIHRLSEAWEFGQDVLDQAAFLEMMTFLNQAFRCQLPKTLPQNHGNTPTVSGTYHTQNDEILSYINQHLEENLTIPMLASRFYLSSSYLCKIFKDTTGTTINRYITAKRISRAKVLLAEGHSVADTGNLCGFRDYSNFLKSFTKAVGISPKKYASYARSCTQSGKFQEREEDLQYF